MTDHMKLRIKSFLEGCAIGAGIALVVLALLYAFSPLVPKEPSLPWGRWSYVTYTDAKVTCLIYRDAKGLLEEIRIPTAEFRKRYQAPWALRREGETR